jgi:hypothetical protein
VCRSTILLKCHIVIINLGCCKQFQHVEVIVWCHSTFRKETRANNAITGKSTPQLTLWLPLSCSTKFWGLTLAHILTLCRWTWPETWKVVSSLNITRWRNYSSLLISLRISTAKSCLLRLSPGRIARTNWSLYPVKCRSFFF